MYGNSVGDQSHFSTLVNDKLCCMLLFLCKGIIEFFSAISMYSNVAVMLRVIEERLHCSNYSSFN
jgi:hypothetical protein